MKLKNNPKQNLNRLKVFIRVIAVFVIIIFIISFMIIHNLNKMLVSTAKSFTLMASETVENKTVGYLRPIQVLNDMINDFDIINTNFLNNTKELNLFGRSFLTSFPQLQSFIIGNQTGEFYMLKTETGGNFSQRLISPNVSEDNVIDRVFTRDFIVLSESKTDAIDFDPRNRPWYIGANASSGNFWTDLYVFHTTQTPGVTIGRAFYDKSGTFNGVFGFDINIYELSQFLSELEFAKLGDVVLMNEAHEIIAYSHPEKIFDQSLSLTPIDVAYFDKPEIMYTLEHSTSDNPVIIFKVNGNEYIGMVRSLHESLGINWKIISLLPTKLFYEAYSLTTTFTVAMNVMILLLIALLTFYRIKELKSSEALYHFAHHDPLTKLYNRNYFNHHYDTSIGKLYALIICDIDHFKTVNDTYGHQVGDIVLQKIAVLFKSHLKSHQVAFRWGGEEFLVLLENEGLDEAIKLAEVLRSALEDNVFEIDDLALKVTMSFGVSEQINAFSFQEIVKRADENLYKAKATGRNKVIY